MMPRNEHSAREHLAWAQWWAFPWKYAHKDWKDDQYPAVDALYRNRRWVPGDFMGVNACLPPTPDATVLQLALASNEQLDLALTLVYDTFNPKAALPLSDSHHQWCTRLSKALPPAMLSPDADPLHLLYAWLDLTTWQRFRLRFPRERAREVENSAVCLENASSRLNTLWQAVVWRVTSLPGDPIAPDSHR